MIFLFLDDGLLLVINLLFLGMNFFIIDNDNDVIDIYCVELFVGVWWFKFRFIIFFNGFWSLYYWINFWFL